MAHDHLDRLRAALKSRQAVQESPAAGGRDSAAVQDRGTSHPARIDGARVRRAGEQLLPHIPSASRGLTWRERLNSKMRTGGEARPADYGQQSAHVEGVDVTERSSTTPAPEAGCANASSVSKETGSKGSTPEGLVTKDRRAKGDSAAGVATPPGNQADGAAVHLPPALSATETSATPRTPAAESEAQALKRKARMKRSQSNYRSRMREAGKVALRLWVTPAEAVQLRTELTRLRVRRFD